MFLTWESTDEVRVPGDHIAVELDWSTASFTNPHGRALTADGLTVDGGMVLTGKCTGEVRLPGAHIAGNLNCSASFTNPTAGL